MRKKKETGVVLATSFILPEKLEKSIEQMTVGEVLQTNTYFAIAERELQAVWNNRNNAKLGLSADQKLKAHPIDELKAQGYLEPGNFIVEYSKVFEKVSDLPKSKREFIGFVGTDIFNKTILELTKKHEEIPIKRKRRSKSAG